MEQKQVNFVFAVIIPVLDNAVSNRNEFTKILHSWVAVLEKLQAVKKKIIGYWNSSSSLATRVARLIRFVMPVKCFMQSWDDEKTGILSGANVINCSDLSGCAMRNMLRYGSVGERLMWCIFLKLIQTYEKVHMFYVWHENGHDFPGDVWLTHWGRDKMAANYLATFSKVFLEWKYINFD